MNPWRIGLGIWLAGCGTLQAFTVELYEVAGEQRSSQINFKASEEGSYRNANQYLKIDNAGTVAREVRLYAQNTAWQRSDDPQAVPFEVFPLFSMAYSSPQPQGVALSALTESSWRRIADGGGGAALNTWTLKPNEVRYVYFASKPPLDAPSSDYWTQMRVEVQEAPAAASTPQEIRPPQTVITPNGDRINDAAVFGLSGAFQIKIFNIQGKAVRTLQNLNTWDGRDDDGEIVESGAYLYQVKADGVKLSGMLAVAR